MLMLLIIAAAAGIAVSAATGIGLLFFVVGGFIFLCGLPGAWLVSFIHGEVSYAQDRADYRAMTADIAAEELAAEYRERKEQKIIVFNDNRQVYYHPVKDVEKSAAQPRRSK